MVVAHPLPPASVRCCDEGEVHAGGVVIFEALPGTEGRDCCASCRECLVRDVWQVIIQALLQPVEVV